LRHSTVRHTSPDAPGAHRFLGPGLTLRPVRRQWRAPVEGDVGHVDPIVHPRLRCRI
jgi:phosphotransferase system IIA component